MNDETPVIERYILSRKDTLWGRAFAVDGPDGVKAAVSFLEGVLEELFDPFTWIEYGTQRDWCTEAVCSTHEGVPYTPEEEVEWEEGYDPCAFVVRLWP